MRNISRGDYNREAGSEGFCVKSVSQNTLEIVHPVGLPLPLLLDKEVRNCLVDLIHAIDVALDDNEALLEACRTKSP